MALESNYQKWLTDTGILPAGTDVSTLPAEDQTAIFGMAFAFHQGDMMADERLLLAQSATEIQKTNLAKNNAQLRQEISTANWPSDPTYVNQLVTLVDQDNAIDQPPYVPGGNELQTASAEELLASATRAQKIVDLLDQAQDAAVQGAQAGASQLLANWPSDARLQASLTQWITKQGLPPPASPPSKEDRTAWGTAFTAALNQVGTDISRWEAKSGSQGTFIQGVLSNYTTAVQGTSDAIDKKKKMAMDAIGKIPASTGAAAA